MDAKQIVRICFNNGKGEFKFFSIALGSEKVVEFNGKEFELRLGKNGVMRVTGVGEKNTARKAYFAWQKSRKNIIRKIKLNLNETTFLGELLRRHEMSRHLNLEDAEDMSEWHRLARTSHFRNIKSLLTKLRFLNAKKPRLTISLGVRIPTNRTKIRAHGMIISAFTC